MGGLFSIKKWYSLEEAASRLSKTFGQEVGVKDVVQFIVEDQMAPYWMLLDETLLPYRAVRFKDADGNRAFRWDDKDLRHVKAESFEVVFAHGEYSTLKINLRRFLVGKGPYDTPTAATFVRGSDGEVHYIMERASDGWAYKVFDSNNDRPLPKDLVILNQSGEPIPRYEYPFFAYDDPLTFSRKVPEVSEIIIIKSEIERFERAALSSDVRVSDWAHAIRNEASRWNIEQFEENRVKPTKTATAKELEVWCRNNGITTDEGNHPSAEYIRRHVLNVWTAPWAMSKH